VTGSNAWSASLKARRGAASEAMSAEAVLCRRVCRLTPVRSARSATAAKAADDETQCRHQSFLSLERLSGHQPACPENGTRAGPRNSELDSTEGACSVLTAFGRGVGQALAPSNGRSVDLRLVTSLTRTAPNS
jgi:hypothetical protein